MKEYIIETVNGQKRGKSRAKAQSLDNLRQRLIREGILDKEEMVVVYTTNVTKVKPDTPFRKVGAIWFDGYNGQYFWLNEAGITKNVSPKTGKLSAFKIKG